jgi:hypothetical protein
MNRSDPIERFLWSIALPGFGQMLNGKYIKGIMFVFLEFLINIQSNFNEIIILSFQGHIQNAVTQTNYRWLMFYPCIYIFAIWDAYRDANDELKPFTFIPFVITAYAVTLGVIYSNTLLIQGILLGPVWLPILFCFGGIAAGLLCKSILTQLFCKTR